MSDSFRNPYHFVPTGPGAPPERLPTADITAPWAAGSASAHLTHDRYVPGTHSGRITCRATVETPLICGNKQEERPGWTKLIHPFEIEPGKPALPASSLRGMLSALAEAATHSTLRVLKGDVLSFRRNMNDDKKLSALGLLVAGEKEGEFKLRPLALPTLELDNGKYNVPASFRGLFKIPAFKVYLGSGQYQSRSFLDSKGQALQNATLKEDGSFGPFYGMKLQTTPAAWGPSASLPSRQAWQRYPRGGQNTRFLIGRQPLSTEVVPWEEGMEAKGYTRGIFRGLGLWTADRQKDDPPHTKIHEFFIPYTPDMEQWTTIPVLPTALDCFHELADQRTSDEPEKNLPYEPLGTRKRKAGDKLRLKAGDIVYFRPEQVAGKSVITEVSFSSIWRGRVEHEGRGADTRAFFAALSSDLLPLHPGRGQLTLAEQLFGTVEVRDKQQQAEIKDPAFSLASRLRISHGLLSESRPEGAYQPYQEWLPDSLCQFIKESGKPDLPLKNLASPKPPSPALYFTEKTPDEETGPKAVRKHELSPSKHLPLGRKFYLRRQPGKLRGSQIFIDPDNLFEQGIAKQHQSVHQFVRPGTEFEFHLQFDNLSALELGLLLYVIQPTAEFRHQIGHGKPLGLGQMQLLVSDLQLVARQARYLTDELTSERSHSAHAEVGTLISGFRAWASKNKLTEVLSALELLGTPPADDLPIHYPQALETDPDRYQSQPIKRGTSAFEKEQFRWFVQNEKLKSGQQYLESLIGQTHLPTLRREPGRPGDGPRGVPAPRGGPAPQPGTARGAPVPQAIISSPESLVGTVQPFSVTKINANKLQFQIALEGLFTGGSVDPATRMKLTPTLNLGDVIPLRIHSYNPGGSTFILTLPEA